MRPVGEMIDRSAQSAQQDRGSTDRFGYSWNHFYDLTDDQESQFRLWTSLIDPKTGWKNRTILDVGCGAGRNSYWAMRYGASGGLAIDLDERSLERARLNLEAFPEMEVRKQSIYDLEYSEKVDIAFGIGVIHHLEEPGKALARMVRATKPGGVVLIWVYGYENMELYVNFMNPIRTYIFSKLPMKTVWWMAYMPAALLWGLLRLGFGRISYFRLIREFSFRHLHHIIVDQMLPQIANYWRRDEVEALMNRAGLQNIELEWVNEMSWAAIGTCPK
ncbi:MAG: methyltransferase [Magnetovibrio sp.]|nr:methyltransferase [Magnetovibrio sp.]